MISKLYVVPFSKGTVIPMSSKESQNLGHRDKRTVNQAFEAALEADGSNKSEWVRQKKREYLKEVGLDEDAADSIIRDIEDDIRELEREIERKKQLIDDIEEAAGELDVSDESEEQDAPEEVRGHPIEEEDDELEELANELFGDSTGGDNEE